LENAEKKTTTDNNSLPYPPLHTPTPSVTHTNPYLDLILKEVIYVVRRHEEIESNKHNIIITRFNSVLFGNHNSKYIKKELHRIWLFMRCLIDLIVNKPEIIGYIVNEMCRNKIIESKENNRPFNTWRRYSLIALERSIRPCVKLFDPQSTQITFFMEPYYELSEKSIYDLENVITKFILDDKEEEREYTLNDLHPIYIDGIVEFLGIYSYPLENVLANIVKEYWTYKLPKLISGKTNILKVTPEIAKFTKEVFQFYKTFYKKINEEFENFECKGVSEKNNIVPFIYYYLCTAIMRALNYIITEVYVKLFYHGWFTNWGTFAKFFIYPIYKISNNFCKKLVIDDNNNKFKLYKYFSNCNNEGLIELVRHLAEVSFGLIYHKHEYMYAPFPEKEDEELIYIRNKFSENENILEKWINYFKKFQ